MMHHLGKRLLALAVCGALTVTGLPASALAAEEPVDLTPENALTWEEEALPAGADPSYALTDDVWADHEVDSALVPAVQAFAAPAVQPLAETDGPQYNTNLVVNGDASQNMYYWGTWTCIGQDGTDKGKPAAKSASGEVDPTGSGYTLPIFMGGSSEHQVTDANQNASSMWQDIDLTKFNASSGKAKYTLSAVIGGYADQADYAVMQVQFKNSGDARLGEVITLNSGHAYGAMTTYPASGTIPAGTVKVNIEVKFYKENREGNNDCDGYIDNIVFKVTENKCITLSYNANGGSGAPAAESVNYNQAHALSSTKPTRTGYTFDGWYTAANGGSKVTSVTPTSNTTVYAHWTANPYTASFGGTSLNYTFSESSVSVTVPALPANSGATFYTGWKYTGGAATGSVTSAILQPGETVNLTGVTGNLTFTAQTTTVSGTPATSEVLTIAQQATPPAPPTQYTYTVRVTGNDALTALAIGGVTVTRASAADPFVLTSTDRVAKTVTVNGESAGTVAANETLTLTYKTLTVTVNKDKAVTLQGGPSLVRTVSGSTYTYTDTKLNAVSVSYNVLVDGEPTGKTAAYGSTTALTYHTATANITVQPGAAVNSVELVSGGKTLPMRPSGGAYTYTGLSGSGTYTLQVNGETVGGQYTNFSSDKTLSTTIYARTVTTKLDGAAADVPGVGTVAISGIYAARTGVGTYLVTKVGAALASIVSINGQRVPASNDTVNYYTVTYSAGSGTGAPVDPNVYLDGTSATVLGPGAMTKADHTFLGWQDLSTLAGETVTVNRKVLLTALWKANAACEAVWHTPGGEKHYGTLDEALQVAEDTPDVTITVQNPATAHGPATIPETATLVVPEGKTVTVSGPVENKGTIENSGTIAGGTLTNTGKVDNDGTLDATVTNSGVIDNEGGAVGGNVTNTGSVEGGTVTGAVSGGTVSGPLTDQGTITGATITGQVTLPPGGEITDSTVNGTVDNQGGTISGTKEGAGSVSAPGGAGTGSTPEEKLVDALGGAAVIEDGVVKLVADVDLTEDPLILDGDVTIDLNGHTITGPDGKPAVQVTGGNVNIQDSSDPDAGSIQGGSGAEGQSGGAGIEVTGSGSVTVTGGEVIGGSGGKGGDGGSGIANTGTGSVSVEGGGVSGGDGGLGEPSGAGGSGVHNSGGGDVSVTGGEVTGGSGGAGGVGGNGVTNTAGGSVDVSGGGAVSGGTGGRVGEGDGGNGGEGVANPGGGTVRIDDSADVSTGESGVNGEGKVTPRKVEAPTLAPMGDQTYTGDAITPTVTLYDGRDVIPPGEYDVTYGSNVNVGTATVTITNKAGKTDARYAIGDTTFTAAFRILPKPVTLTWSGDQGLVYDGAPVSVTATAGSVAEKDTCTVTVANGAQTDAGSYTATATGLSNPNYTLPDGDLTASYTIAPKPVTLTWNGADGLVYSGAPVSVTATAGALVGSDACAVTVTGGAETDAGTHTATATTLSNPNYTLPEVTTKRYTIAKATPALSALSATDITYGDTLSASTVTGAASHPTTNAAVNGVWSWSTGEGSKHPTVASDSGVTAYAVTFTPADGDNYNKNDATVTLAVHKAALTPSVSSVDGKVYDGSPATTGAVQLTGAVLDETPAATGTFSFNSANVTEADAVNVTAITLSDSWGDNYALSTATLSGVSTTAQITPKTVSLTWDGCQDLVYDRSPVNVTAAAGALVTGDACAVTVAGGTETDAGTYTATATALSNTNYQLPEGVTQDYTIAKCPVTFTVTHNDVDYHHGGHPKAEVTSPGLTKDAEFTVSYRQTGQVIEPHFSGTYDIMVQLADPNFKFAGQEDATRELKVGELTINHVNYEGAIKWPTASNPITYGQPLGDVAFAGGSGSAEGGTGTFFWKAPASFPDVAATTAVMVFDPEDPEYDNVEYDVAITVNKAALTPSVDAVEDKVYDGNTSTTGTVKLEGAQFEETPAAVGTFHFVDKNAAENKSVNVTDITLTDSWNNNYVLSTTALSAIPTAAKITPKPVTLTWDGDQELVYSGKPVNVTAAAGSLVEGDSCAVTVDEEGRATHAGAHTATATALSNPNYMLPQTVTWDYSISPKPVTLLWHNLIQPYNGADRTPRAVTSLDAANGESAVTLQGVVPEDDGAADVVFAVTRNGQRAQAVNAGNYMVTGAMREGSNYVVTGYNAAQLTVQKAPVRFTITDNTLKEGDPRHGATLTPTPAGVPFTVQYKNQKGETVDPATEDLEAGTYPIWVTVEDPNYHHVDSATGDAARLGVFTVYAQTPPPKYAVRFEADDPDDEGTEGGVVGVLTGTMEPLDAAQEGTLRTLPDCAFTCTGYSFAGWKLNGQIYPAGAAYTQQPREVTFTAQWIKTVHTVEGVVDQDGKPVSDVQVTLMLGSNVVAQRHTDPLGKFRFENIVPGLYNLVAAKDGVTMTVEATIVDQDEARNITLPTHKTNSVVVVAPGTPNVVVGNLENSFTDADKALAAQEDVSTEVEYKFTVQQEPEDAGNADHRAIREMAGSATPGLYLELTLEKTVTQGDTVTSSEIPESHVILESTIPLPAQLQGKYRYAVIRRHGAGEDAQAEILRTTPNDDGEYFEVNEDKTVLTVFAKKFSTYAVAYADPPAASHTYPPAVTPAEHGQVVSKPIRPAEGDEVTLTVKPEEGYELDTITILDKDGNPVPCTVNADGTVLFTQPEGAVTVTPVFKPVDVPCPRDETCPAYPFPDLDLKLWYHDGIHFCVEQGLMNGYGNGKFGPYDTLTRAMLAQILYNKEGRPAVSGTAPFADVDPGAWYAQGVAWAAQKGVVKGYGDGTFGPHDPITREQLATMLYRYEQRYGRGGFTGMWMFLLDFHDADQVSQWADEAVHWMTMHQVVQGKGDKVLDPKGQATRAEGAAMLQRYIELAQ